MSGMRWEQAVPHQCKTSTVGEQSMSLRQRNIGIHPMKGLPEHHEVEAALRGVPALERGDLDRDSLAPRDIGHSRIRLNRKNISSLRKELLGSDPGARANVEHGLRARQHKVIDELGRVARPMHVIGSRRGTEGVCARTVEVEICAWLYTESLRSA